MNNQQDELLKSLFKEQIQAELDLLSQRVKAEQDTANELKRRNDLEQQALDNAKKLRQIESQRNQLWLDISERTANLVQELPHFKLTILGLAEKLDQLERQSLEDIAQRLDRLERAIILLLAGSRNSQSKELIKEIEAEDHRRRLLKKKYESLWKLEEQLADYGLDKPIHLVNQIDNLKSEIDTLEE